MELKKAMISPQKESFSQGVCRISRADALPKEWSMYRMTFTADNNLQQAKLLMMGAEYFMVYINGVFCAEYSIRSYIYHRAYEVYNVNDYIHEGQNVIAVLACETGKPNNRGFACELKLQSDGQTTSFSNGWKTTKCEAIAGALTYTLGPAPEIYDARKELDGWNTLDFKEYFTAVDNPKSAVTWQDAEIVGAVDSFPYTNLVQSFQKAQTRNEISPDKIIFVQKTEPYLGYDICFPPVSNQSSAYMTCITALEDAVFSIVPMSGVSVLSLNGKTFAANTQISIPAGSHTLSIANYNGGKTTFQIRTEGKLTFSSTPNNSCSSERNDSWVCFTAPKKSITYRIGWNEKYPKFPPHEDIQTFMTASDFTSLKEHIRSACLPASIEPCDLWYQIMNQKHSDSELTINDAFLSGNETIIPAREKAITLMLDYHREHVGLLTLDIDAPVGTEITYFTFEMITPSGIRYMGSHLGVHGKYICRNGRQKHIMLRRQGFRYAVITIPPCSQDIKLYGVNVIETRYPSEPAGAFRSDDNYLNGIYDMSINTAKVCMMDSYVDCCGCEQNTWVGDAGITAAINMVNFGEQAFDSRYLDMIGRSMDSGLATFYRPNNKRYLNGLALPCGCFPTYPPDGLPIWSFMWVLQVLEHHLYFGADEAFEQRLTDIDECFNRCKKLTNQRGLFETDGAWNLIEWADNDLMTCGEVTANNIMLAYCLIEVSKLLKELGRTQKAAEYEAMGMAYRDAVNRLCWDENAHAYVDTLRDEEAYAHYVEYCKETGRPIHTYEEYLSCGRISVQTNTFALLYDCVPENRKQYCIDLLLESVKTGKYLKGTPANVEPNQEKKLVGIGSPFFLYFTLKTLYKLGYHDIATNVIRRDWGEMYDDGLTTCVETFRGTNGEWGRSVAHAWSASPAIYLITEVLGIKPIKPGYTEFSIEPHPNNLTYAKGAVPTPYGNIYVEWTFKNNQLEITYNAPKECRRMK